MRDPQLASAVLLCCLLSIDTQVALPSGTDPSAPPDPASVAAQVRKALVIIKCERTDGSIAQASRFIVDSSGVIVTNYHVVADAKTIAIKTADGEIYDTVEVTGFDQRRDLALLRVSGHGLPSVTLGDSSLAQPGAPVMVVGNPLGLEGSVSTGVVSALRDSGEGYKVLQLTAPVSEGSSGAPVLDANGMAIGVVSFRVVGGESLNFAIPSQYVKGLLDNPKTLPLRTLGGQQAPSEGLFGTSQPRRVSSIAEVKKVVITPQTVEGVEDPRGIGPLCTLALETELASHGFEVVSSRSEADADLVVTASYSYLTFGPIWKLGRIDLSFGVVLRRLGTKDALFGYTGEASGKPGSACESAAREVVDQLAAAKAEATTGVPEKPKNGGKN